MRKHKGVNKKRSNLRILNDKQNQQLRQLAELRPQLTFEEYHLAFNCILSITT